MIATISMRRFVAGLAVALALLSVDTAPAADAKSIEPEQKQFSTDDPSTGGTVEFGVPDAVQKAEDALKRANEEYARKSNLRHLAVNLFKKAEKTRDEARAGLTTAESQLKAAERVLRETEGAARSTALEKVAETKSVLSKAIVDYNVAYYDLGGALLVMEELEKHAQEAKAAVAKAEAALMKAKADVAK